MAKNLELRLKLNNTFDDTDSLIYIRAHWDELDGKPVDYTPTPHSHIIGDVTNLQTTLNNLSAGIDDFDDYTQAHAYASNPHNITPALIGALPSGSKAADSDKLDGLDNTYYGRVTPSGDWHSFTDPLTDESGYIDTSWTNKFEFFNTSYILVETSADDITYTETTEYSDAQLKNLMGGDGNANITIPNLGTIGTAYKRFTFTCYSYVSLSQLYNYVTRVYGSLEIKVEKRQVNTWTTVKDFSSIGGWPAHTTLRHGTIWFNPSTISTGHYWQVRITYKGTTTNASYINHTINKMMWWGGYPSGRRNRYYTDSAGNIDFPSIVKAQDFQVDGQTLVKTNDSRLSDARPASSITTSVLGSGTPANTTFLNGMKQWVSIPFSILTGDLLSSQVNKYDGDTIGTLGVGNGSKSLNYILKYLDVLKLGVGDTADNSTKLNGQLASYYSAVGHTHTKSQITDFPTSMPASDVSAWAKKSSMAASDMPYANDTVRGAVRISESGSSLTIHTSD